MSYNFAKIIRSFKRVHGLHMPRHTFKYKVYHECSGRWVTKLIARLLDTAALWVRIQTSLKNTKWAT